MLHWERGKTESRTLNQHNPFDYFLSYSCEWEPCHMPSPSFPPASFQVTARRIKKVIPWHGFSLLALVPCWARGTRKTSCHNTLRPNSLRHCQAPERNLTHCPRCAPASVKPCQEKTKSVLRLKFWQCTEPKIQHLQHRGSWKGKHTGPATVVSTRPADPIRDSVILVGCLTA